MKLDSQISFFSSVDFTSVLLFTKHLSVMLKSGVSIVEALDVITDQTKNQTFKIAFQDIGEKVKNGQSLYKALSNYPKIFNPFYLYLIKVGEEAGTLDQNLVYLGITLKKNHDFKKKVESALLYPEIVLTTALFVGGGISIFVLPQLTDLFKSMDFELPLATKILLSFSGIMKQYGVLIIVAILFAIFIFRSIIKTPFIKPIWQRFLLKLPVLGVFIQNVELSAFCRNLGMMLKSGLPITSAIDTQKQSTTNDVYRYYLEVIEEDVNKGKSISESIINNKLEYFSTLATRMIAVGEKTGKLDESLIYLGDYFEEEVDSAAKDFSVVLEPIILLGVGLVVAYLALAIISPIYQFTGSIKR